MDNEKNTENLSQAPKHTTHIKYGRKLVYGYVVLLVLAAIAGLIGYARYHHHNNPKTTTSSSTATVDTNKHSIPDPYAGWKTYTSKMGGFTILYPQSWSIEGFTGQYNMTTVPASSLTGNESSILLASSSANSNSFGIWLSINSSSSPTSSSNSAFTQIPYAQGAIIETLSSGIGIWEANQTLTMNGGTYSDNCTPFESASNHAFGFKLNNNKYLDASMSFCYSAHKTTTNTYSQQASSSELQQALTILSSLRQV